MTLSGQPIRCHRCGGSGDVPMILDDCFVHPDRPPVFQCCPDCGGTGLLRERVAPEPEIEPELLKTKRRRAR